MEHIFDEYKQFPVFLLLNVLYIEITEITKCAYRLYRIRNTLPLRYLRKTE